MNRPSFSPTDSRLFASRRSCSLRRHCSRFRLRARAGHAKASCGPALGGYGPCSSIARCASQQFLESSAVCAPALLLVVAERARHEESIDHDLTEMKAKGYGGVLLVDANGARCGKQRSCACGTDLWQPCVDGPVPSCG